ncbi:2-oxo acid dehydrogenase subunit E2 [SAR202 cluster bacterium AD-802-E10_MRT_200m]|nr:2-oxo acid dehydrogenase subunit E2 [SAR202 cluster bacterium AD-802-E10_MRT_200m]
MPSTIVMPQMGYDMQEGRIIKWLKNEGDSVERGQDIVELETDKAVVPIPSSSSGILRKILVEEGIMVPVGQPIGIMTAPDEALPEDLNEIINGSTTEAVVRPEAESLSTANSTPAVFPTDSSEVRASPLARRLAQENNIDITSISGTGPRGRITERDVQAVIDAGGNSSQGAVNATATDQEGASETVELSRMRQAIARLTSRSKQEIPHFYVSAGIDMTAAMLLRQHYNSAMEDKGVRVSVNDLIVKACALALPKFPSLNSSFHGDKLQVHGNVNMGIAIDLEDRGLIVPAIPRCEDRTLAEIAAASKDLADRAKADRLKAEEYTGSTFTVSNLGMFDVDNFVAIIHPPNSAVLAVGTVRQQPVVRENAITIAQMMNATVSVDHRVADGAGAARFISEVKRLLEHPINLFQ